MKNICPARALNSEANHILDAMKLSEVDRNSVAACILKYQGAPAGSSVCERVQNSAFLVFNGLKACIGRSDWQKMVKKVSHYEASNDPLVIRWSRYNCIGSAIQMAADCQNGLIRKVPKKVVAMIGVTVGGQRIMEEIKFSHQEMRGMPTACL